MADRLLPVESAARSVAESEPERTLTMLYRRRAQDMFGFARRLGLGDDDASDAVQETMIRLWHALDSATEVDDPEAWSFRVLYRISVDHHRLRRRVGGLLERLGAGGRAALEQRDPADRFEVDSVWQAVDRLPARQRAVLYLRYRADLAYEQIGLALSITPSAARGHASTGLATLRRLLGDEVQR